MKSWTFINLPRRADCLEPGSVFLPPLFFFPSCSVSMGSSATEPEQSSQAGRPGSLQIIKPLTPCLVTGKGGKNPKGQGSGSRSERGGGKVVSWACLQKQSTADAIMTYTPYGDDFRFSSRLEPLKMRPHLGENDGNKSSGQASSGENN